MTTVKFDKSVKYNGIRYAAHVAFDVNDEDVPQLVQSGATILSTKPDTPPINPPKVDGEEKGNGGGQAHTGGIADDPKNAGQVNDGEDVTKLKEQLLEYTVAELTEFADKRGIDLQGKTRKADIYNVIVAALN